jgi:hypothetical protein
MVSNGTEGVINGREKFINDTEMVSNALKTSVMALK